MLEMPNVAVSSGPLGKVVGVQLVTVSHKRVIGLRFQVALAANVGDAKSRINRARATRSEIEARLQASSGPIGVLRDEITLLT